MTGSSTIFSTTAGCLSSRDGDIKRDPLGTRASVMMESEDILEWTRGVEEEGNRQY